LTISLSCLGIANAQLNEADINYPKSIAHKAWCSEKRTNCEVRFHNKKLIVNQGAGITLKQVKAIKKARICRYRTFLSGIRCNRYQDYDKDFLIKYISSDQIERLALITFRNEAAARRFQEDLDKWSLNIKTSWF
tara:strand:- start:317 stop:721 length:405 start_codon:yes stop_codon:yes gene_type:complete